MNKQAQTVASFLEENPKAIHVCLTKVLGSSPREAGTEMLVAPNRLWGTIGGGRLEYLAIERARQMLSAFEMNAKMDVPLGPEIGQCCGGRVEINLRRIGAAIKRDILSRAQTMSDQLPHVYVIGSGHVGRALANQLQHMPVKTVVVDMRAEELDQCDADVEKRQIAIPEFTVMSAPSNSAFIVATHDHALDFLVTASALEKGNACYVGMIGSATKRVKFEKWVKEHLEALPVENLVCPMGSTKSLDKRPSVIASFIVAEVLAELFCEDAKSNTHKQLHSYLVEKKAATQSAADQANSITLAASI